MIPQEQNLYVRLLPGKSDRTDPGKWLPVWMHLEDTAGIMEKLVSKWLPPNIQNYIDCQLTHRDISSLGKLLAYLHDIGKFTPVFAARILESLSEIRSRLAHEKIDIPELSFFVKNSPHALAGQCILTERKFPAGIAVIVGAHHGAPQETLLSEDIEYYPGNYYGKGGQKDPNKHLWDDLWDQWIRYALTRCGYDSVEDLPSLNQSAQMLLTGLLIMSDWIASNPYYFPLIDIDSTGDLNAYPERISKAWEKFSKDRIDIWTPFVTYAAPEDFSDRFQYIAKEIQPNIVQKSFIDILNKSDGHGVFILEAPMGYGKTEAALFAAEMLAAKTGASGIFFGLPTQATANGIFTRLLPWAESQSEGTVHSIRLAHGMAELNDDYRDLFEGNAEINSDDESSLIVHEWFRGRKQALLSDFVIGTVDQMLLAGLSRKHVMLRHLGLAGKVVILDECHAYDAYMNHYMDTVLRWLGSYGTPVIILSATLPAKRRAEIIRAYVGKKDLKRVDNGWESSRGYPLLTWSDGNEPHTQAIQYTDLPKPVTIDRIRDEEIITYLEDALSDGGCAGIIVNTVKRAQTLAETIEKEMPDHRVILFHSQFIAPDRAERERKLLELIGKDSSANQRDGLIIVGTQVLEQSLDIDFDYMITDLCPMDLLLQRIGRLHRHKIHDAIRPKKLRHARCSVLGTLDDDFLNASEKIYGKWLLLRTKEVLPDRIALPTDIPELVQEVYADPAGSSPEWDEYRTDQIRMERKADQFCIPKPAKNARRNTIIDLLNQSHPGNDAAAEAGVRDGDQSISVLVMKQCSDGSVRFLARSEDETVFSRDHQPSSEEARKIARQKLNLPYIFNLGRNAEQAINELEFQNKTVLPDWQQAPMLKGELVLLVNEKNQADLCGYQLTYDHEKGLMYERKGENESE